jgi:hypothetical protein
VFDLAVRALAATPRRIAIAAVTVVVALLLLAAGATAELTQHGNLFIRFDGGISPLKLQRSEPTPVSVRIEGTVRTLEGDRAPGLREIEVAVNRGGKVNATGLPTCRRNRLETATPSEALASCGPALVGSGGIVARTTLDDQTEVTVRAEIILFNALDHGHTAVLAHVYETKPLPAAHVMTFKIRRQSHGTFGTVISGRMPSSFDRNGYVKSIFLHLGRRYTYRGQQRSYITATCAAPAGFNAASFPFAHAAMTFADGRKLASTLVRTCRVAG